MGAPLRGVNSRRSRSHGSDASGHAALGRVLFARVWAGRAAVEPDGYSAKPVRSALATLAALRPSDRGGQSVAPFPPTFASPTTRRLPPWERSAKLVRHADCSPKGRRVSETLFQFSDPCLERTPGNSEPTIVSTFSTDRFRDVGVTRRVTVDEQSAGNEFNWAIAASGCGLRLRRGLRSMINDDVRSAALVGPIAIAAAAMTASTLQPIAVTSLHSFCRQHATSSAKG